MFPRFLFGISLDSLLSDNRLRAGSHATELFAPLENPDANNLDANKLLDYKFLLANLPLADLALMTREDLLENVNLAAETLNRFSWAAKVSPEMYLHYVLPHRVSQEPFVHWRKPFLEEIGPRVENLSLKEAILEVNHWCHEKATYRPTDGRDQDPLTTIRSGFGRCEEEMILTIAALRSVGIPARQCYTPYWAHSDDNHAWVEAWGGDGWYYLGACEPAQELNQAWFSGPAQRAMLVVSTAYGDYGKEERGKRKEETEPVLRRYGRSTLINSTAVYGPTKELAVTVLDRKNKPIPKCKVIFSLWNYGTLMPAMSVFTDSTGVARLVCGKGDWFVSTPAPPSIEGGAGGGEDDIWFWFTGIPKKVRSAIVNFVVPKPKPLMAFAEVNAEVTEVTLKLDSVTPANWPTEAEYTPPPKPEAKAPDVISAEGEARGVTTSQTQSPPSIEGGLGGIVHNKALAGSLFGARLAWEDSVREAGVWSVWEKDNKGNYSGEPFDTSLWSNQTFMTEVGFTSYFRKARGNWGEVMRSLTGVYPADEYRNIVPIWSNATRLPQVGKGYLITGLSDKDLRDFSAEVFYDHLKFHSLSCDLGDRNSLYSLPRNDSVAFARYQESVITPRIDTEPSLPWREDLIDFLKVNPNLIEPDEALLLWLRSNITLESTPDRLGPPLTPAQCLELRRGTEGDIERLYIGLCRVRGIPARRNPVTNQVERWESVERASPPVGNWITVDVLEKKKEERGKQKEEKGSLTITLDTNFAIYNLQFTMFGKDWALARWNGNQTEVMDLGWHQSFEAMAWPVDIPEGWYLLSSGIRREDGSAPVRLQWIEVKGDVSAELRMKNLE